MRKITILVTLIFISAISFAQVKRQTNPSSPSFQSVKVLKSINNLPSGAKAVLDTLHYDGDNSTSIGTDGPANFGVYAFFPAATLASHVTAGHVILSEMLYINGVSEVASAQLRFYSDTLETALVYSQTFTPVEGWNNVLLTTPLIIPATGNLYIGYNIITIGGSPAGCDAGPANANGNWIFFENDWGHVNDLNSTLIGNWNIRAMCGTPPTTTPGVACSQLSWNAGEVYTGTSVSKTFSMKNVGIGTLTVSGITGLTAPYTTTLTPGSVHLSAGQTTTFTITFAPTVAGAINRTVVIATNAGNVTLTLTGSGLSCTAIATFPWSEGFEGGATLPTCWSLNDVDGDSHNWEIHSTGKSPHSGTYSIVSASYDNATSTALTPDNYLITPKFNINNANLSLAFWVAGQDPLYPQEHYSVMVSNTGTAPANFTEVFSQTLADTIWSQKIVSLAAYNGQEIYIAFRHHNSTDNFQIKLDDISINTPCVTPSIFSATNITQTSADLGWSNTASNYNIRYRKVGTTPWSVTISSNSNFSLTMLTSNTQYEVQVQAICSSTVDDVSSWSSLNMFTTLATPCVTPSIFSATNITQTSADLSWTNTAANYNVRYRKVGTTPWTVTISSNSNLSLTLLALNTQYEVQVQSICSSTVGDISSWSSLNMFTTLATSCVTPSIFLATNITQTSADLGWTNTAANYNIRYRIVGTIPWFVTTSSNNNLSLTMLSVNTSYEVSVQSICSSTVGDVSSWSSLNMFTTLAPPCVTPSIFGATNITQTSADLGWTNTAANYNIRYRIVGATPWTIIMSSNSNFSLTMLSVNTSYEVQVQAICSSTLGDTSTWSSLFPFTTGTASTCNAPSALAVTAMDDASATLNWNNGGIETAWNIRHKKVADITYTEDNNTTTKPYILTSLQSSTAYVWNVQAVCNATLSSAWSTESTFTTQSVGIETNSLSNLSVYSYNKQVNVINNDNLLVKAVVIYDMIGQEVATYAINSTDNILINTNFTSGNYVVKIVTDIQVMTKKLNIK